MALTAEQHSELANAYDSAASDTLVPPEQRAAFARKAELFRLLAKLAAKQAAYAQQKAPSPSNAEDVRREVFQNLVKKRLRSEPQARRTGNTGACSGFDRACA